MKRLHAIAAGLLLARQKEGGEADPPADPPKPADDAADDAASDAAAELARRKAAKAKDRKALEAKPATMADLAAVEASLRDDIKGGGSGGVVAPDEKPKGIPAVLWFAGGIVLAVIGLVLAGLRRKRAEEST